MKNKGAHVKGFTLMEILAVVLIIGILAVIGVPQYMKSTEKSRATEAVQLLDQLFRAEKMFKLTTKRYTFNVDDLDITFPNVSSNGHSNSIFSTNNFTFEVLAIGGSSEDKFSYLLASAERNKNTNKYYIFAEMEGNRKSIWCSPEFRPKEGVPTEDLGDDSVSQLCKAIANGNPRGIISRQ